MENQHNSTVAPFAEAVQYLLTGVVYKEERKTAWEQIMQYTKQIKHFLMQINVELIIIDDDKSGFAYLRHFENDETPHLRKLLKTQRLSYELSVLCMLLREKLEDFDDSTNRSADLYMTRKEIHLMIAGHCAQRKHLDKLTKDLDAYIKDLIENRKILRHVGDTSAEKSEHKFKVLRIIKAMFTVETLNAFNTKINPNETAE